MKALLFRKSIPRYLLLRMLGPRFRGLYSGGLPPVSLCDVPAPKLIDEHWVRIAPTLAGLCGSDLATITAKGSPYLAPVTSLPFVLGHEMVGTITEVGSAVADHAVGDRVVLQPALGCTVRGIDPPCDACSRGAAALCRNVTRGQISAGIQTGYCRDTGGAFGESLVAHESQLFSVPDDLDDKVAVLVEPFACALHAALRVSLKEADTALVIGCGAIGLLTIAALRATGCPARIVAVARYEHQRRCAQALGANVLLDAGGDTMARYTAWAQTLDAEVLRPQLGKPAVIGGATVTFDCVASSQSIDDAIRFTRAGGTLVLVGMPSVPRGIDWTPLWYKELTLKAAYAYGLEQVASPGSAPGASRVSASPRDTFDLAIDLARSRQDKLEMLVGTPHALTDYRAAIAAALDTNKSGVAKTLFAIEHGRE